MTLYAYIVRWDDGFAPNPFQGVCTLACCKYVTRRVAQVGDYIVGLNSKSLGNRLVYAMQISETMTFDEYWRDRRFRAKRPDMSAGGEKALGDNIYRWDAKRQEYRQAHSLHSNRDGTENLKNKRHDTKGNDYWVLISNKFTYWGDQSPDDPPFLINIVKHGPGHKSKANDPYIPDFKKWFAKQKPGCLGSPTNGMPEPAGKGKRKRGKGC